uniref:PHD and RING finger domain-containing protein 1 n=1 Tax=Plectus sambesii TaxID=2011161 RepID=A0A914VP81_9BILA
MASTTIAARRSESPPIDECCPICLNAFDAEIGSPEACDHKFCLPCIQEWARNTNTCPIDRQTFGLIFIRNELNGPVVLRVPVGDGRLRPADDEELDEDEDEDPTNCEICGAADREDRMLLCDDCDNGYHMECLTPPLNAVPLHEWFCPECAPRHAADDNDGPAAAAGRRRIIPRTEAAERVRARLERRFAASSDESEGESSAEEADEPADVDVPTVSTPTAPKPKKTPQKRRRRRYKRRKSTKRKGGRRRRRRRRRTITPKKTDSVHQRLANQLGVSAPRPGHFLPGVKSSGASSSGYVPANTTGAGFTPLYLFGNSKQLPEYELDASDDDDTGPISRNALRFNQPLRRTGPKLPAEKSGRTSSTTSQPTAVAPVPKEKTAAAGGDLLDSIIAGQSLALAPAQHIRVRRDGSLEATESMSKYQERLERKRNAKRESAAMDIEFRALDSAINSKKLEQSPVKQSPAVKQLEECEPTSTTDATASASLLSNTAAQEKDKDDKQTNGGGDQSSKDVYSSSAAATDMDRPESQPMSTEDDDGDLDIPAERSEQPPPSAVAPPTSARKSRWQPVETVTSLPEQLQQQRFPAPQPLMQIPIDPPAALFQMPPRQQLPPQSSSMQQQQQQQQQQMAALQQQMILQQLAQLRNAQPSPPPSAADHSMLLQQQLQQLRGGALFARPPSQQHQQLQEKSTLPQVQQAQLQQAQLQQAQQAQIQQAQLQQAQQAQMQQAQQQQAQMQQAQLPPMSAQSRPPPPIPTSVGLMFPPHSASALMSLPPPGALSGRGGMPPMPHELMGQPLLSPSPHRASSHDLLRQQQQQQQQGPGQEMLRPQLLSQPALLQMQQAAAAAAAAGGMGPPTGLPPGFSMLIPQLAHQQMLAQQHALLRGLVPTSMHDQLPGLSGLQQLRMPPQMMGGGQPPLPLWLLGDQPPPPPPPPAQMSSASGGGLSMNQMSQMNPPGPPNMFNPSLGDGLLPIPHPAQQMTSLANNMQTSLSADAARPPSGVPPELVSMLTQFSDMKRQQLAREAMAAGPSTSAAKRDSSPAEKRARLSMGMGEGAVGGAPRTPPATQHESDDDFAMLDDDDDDDLGDAGQDMEAKLSKAEKLQKRKERKLQRLMMEATSTTGDDDSLPASAVEMNKREKLLAKFNYQVRVEEEVKLALRPYYGKKRITKDDYKEIMRKTVPKICKKKGQINPAKIKSFVETYVQKILSTRKHSSKP